MNHPPERCAQKIDPVVERVVEVCQKEDAHLAGLIRICGIVQLFAGNAPAVSV